VRHPRGRQSASPPRRRPVAGSRLPALLLGAKLAGLIALLVVYATGCDEAEQQLMAHSATAAPEIERRLGQWLTTRDGLLYVREPAEVHVLRAVASVVRRDGIERAHGRFLERHTDVVLDERQCNELLSVLGQAMLTLTATDRPAPQQGKDNQ
jgi:hypothetical protein